MDQICLLKEAILFVLLLYILVGLLYYSNDHIQKNEVQNESSQHPKKEVSNPVGATVSLGLDVNLSKGEEIHLDESIDLWDEGVETNVVPFVLLVGVKVENVEEVAKGAHDDQPHDVESLQAI